LIQRRVDLYDYKRKDFRRLSGDMLKDPEQKALADMLMVRFFTGVADAALAARIGALNATHRVPTDVIFARDFATSYLQSDNVILLGSRRSNPWLDLFENRLNFRSGFDEQATVSYFENHSPLAGEKPVYRGEWEVHGYCRVVCLPNLSGTGNLLLVSGTDLASTGAGGEFITSERWVGALQAALAVTGHERFPYFEVLLKTELLVPASFNFEIVGHRILKP
jgi:hypothetical protein